MTPRSVRHYCPGGTEHGGGIGRLVGYVVAAAGEAGATHVVSDTRGATLSLLSPLHLAGALAAMARDRVRHPDRVHHIHVAGRGSTVRKLILAGTAAALGCATVVHLHDYDYGSDLAGRTPWLRRRIAAMFRGADRVIVLGRRDRDTVVDLGVAPERVAVMHNAVPDPGRPARPEPGDGARILFLGRLGARKGTPELIRALASEAMAGLPWCAVLAGDGPVDDTRREVEALGIAGRVALPGWLDADRTRALLASADILVLPSHAEGMAMAVIEGLAYGLAVVTTAVGAHGEAIVSGRDGLFVPVGDAAALADALAELVRDDALRARLAAAGRDTFVKSFSMTAYVERLEDLYAGIGRVRDLVTA